MSDFSQLEQQFAFIIEIDRLKAVLRKNKPVTIDRYENTAEHSWQVALLALTLTRHATEPVDTDKVIRMLLLHDLAEIDTGDAILYGDNHHGAEREQAERAAVKRIFGLLPDAQAATFFDIWQEFEDQRTPEARFAHAMDRLMPVLLNLALGGQSWRENGVSKAQVLARAVSQVALGCPLAADWLRDKLDSADAAGFFG